jgi:hypothetical protein
LPLAQLSTALTGWADSPSTLFPNAAGAASAAQVLAGLEPKAPAWIAAGLSSLGAWISLPLQLMAIWITYGLFVLLVARLLGATPTLTLQRFYAATGYAFLPLMLTMLAPLACVGTIAGLAAWLWSFLLYVATVRFRRQSGYRQSGGCRVDAGCGLSVGLAAAPVVRLCCRCTSRVLMRGSKVAATLPLCNPATEPPHSPIPARH